MPRANAQIWGGGLEKSFCTIAGMSWLSSSAVHAARKRRAAASTSPKSNGEWKPLRAKDEFAVIAVSPSIPCCEVITPFHISLGKKPRIRSPLSRSPKQRARRVDGAATPLWKNWLLPTPEKTLNQVPAETQGNRM